MRKAIKDWFGILIMKSKSLSMKSSSTIDAKTSKVKHYSGLSEYV